MCFFSDTCKRFHFLNDESSTFSPSTEVMIWFVVAGGKIDELSSFLTPPFFSTKNSEKEPYSS